MRLTSFRKAFYSFDPQKRWDGSLHRLQFFRDNVVRDHSPHRIPCTMEISEEEDEGKKDVVIPIIEMITLFELLVPCDAMYYAFRTVQVINEVRAVWCVLCCRKNLRSWENCTPFWKSRRRRPHFFSCVCVPLDCSPPPNSIVLDFSNNIYAYVNRKSFAVRCAHTTTHGLTETPNARHYYINRRNYCRAKELKINVFVLDDDGVEMNFGRHTNTRTQTTHQSQHSVSRSHHSNLRKNINALGIGGVVCAACKANDYCM